MACADIFFCVHFSITYKLLGTGTIVSSPMKILPMTYLALKALGLPKNRVIGMGGALDSSRFKYFLSQAIGCNANEGDTYAVE